MATPYQKVVKAALMNWMKLSEEEANNKINTKTIEELEGQVYAMGSMKYAVAGLANQIGLTEEETINFFSAVIKGPENGEIFSVVQSKAAGLSEDQKLGILSTIHDGWVQDNSNEKTFNKKVEKQQLRQYAPLELIGWNEVKSDLLFLNPILESINIQIDEQQLSTAYHNKVSKYLESHNIASQEDVTNLIQQGRSYYPILPQELESRLSPRSTEISSQILNNWEIQDSETYQLFQERSKKLI